MDVRDKVVLQRWLRGRATLADVEGYDRVGLVDNVRFSEQAVRAYRLLWSWSAPRFGGNAGRKQDRVYAKCGPAFVARRIARARAIAGRLRGEWPAR